MMDPAHDAWPLHSRLVLLYSAWQHSKKNTRTLSRAMKDLRLSQRSFNHGTLRMSDGHSVSPCPSQLSAGLALEVHRA